MTFDDNDPTSYTVQDLARAAARRLEWELETGSGGVHPEPARTPLQDAARDEIKEDIREELRMEIEEEARAEIQEDKASALSALREEIGDCTRCDLHKGRNKLVFGDGNPEARLVFVGEGPGRDEDMTGLPFVGAAGKLLTKIIAAIGLSRDEVFICNVVKCRPPNNRDPEPEETAVCGPFMRKQLEIIRPEVIVCLGRPSAQYLLGTDASIGRLRGRFHKMGEIDVMPTYHPAYLLRNESAKRPVWEDMKMVRDRLGLPGGTK